MPQGQDAGIKCSVPVSTCASWCKEMSLDRVEITFRVKDVHKFVRHVHSNVLDKSEIFESAQLKWQDGCPQNTTRRIPFQK